MNSGSKLFPLECTQAKMLMDGCLVSLRFFVRNESPHVRRTMDIAVSQKLTLSKLKRVKIGQDSKLDVVT